MVIRIRVRIWCLFRFNRRLNIQESRGQHRISRGAGGARFLLSLILRVADQEVRADSKHPPREDQYDQQRAADRYQQE